MNSSNENLNVSLAKTAAMTLVTMSASVIKRPAFHEEIRTMGSTSIPTESRKKAMKSALPRKLTRFINVEDSGIRRLSKRPARKAPMMASTPATTAPYEQTKRAAITKTYSAVASGSTLEKNQRPSLGSPKKTTNA